MENDQRKMINQNQWSMEMSKNLQKEHCNGTLRPSSFHHDRYWCATAPNDGHYLRSGFTDFFELPSFPPSFPPACLPSSSFGHVSNFGLDVLLFFWFSMSFLLLVVSVGFATCSCQFSAFSSTLWSFPFNSLCILLYSMQLFPDFSRFQVFLQFYACFSRILQCFASLRFCSLFLQLALCCSHFAIYPTGFMQI